jgi:hypothetical protein
MLERVKETRAAKYVSNFVGSLHRERRGTLSERWES